MFCFSIKTCIQLLKDDNRTPLLDVNNKPTEIIRYVNELIEKGVKGTLKKESVISTLQELVVRFTCSNLQNFNNFFQFNFRQYMWIFPPLY